MNEKLFLCPFCKAPMALPRCSMCGNAVPHDGAVWYFCEASGGACLDGENRYIGYDGIGENFEPAVIYWDSSHTVRYGVYEACGDLIADTFGCDITVLDLGAGLGSAAVPLARRGIRTVAADISAVMLSCIGKRPGGNSVHLTAAKMNAYSLMLADHSVDLIVENAMLHLTDHPRQVIEEMCRVLKPGGKLIRYASPMQPLSAEEQSQNRRCNRILDDISSRYYQYLEEHHAVKVWFDAPLQEMIAAYFEAPYRISMEGFSEVFTEKLKFRLHRLRTGAHSDLQHLPKALLENAWQVTDAYARRTYGDAYMEIPGFSRYGAAIDVYALKSE